MHDLIDCRTGEFIRAANEEDLRDVNRNMNVSAIEAKLGRKVLGTVTENCDDYRVAFVVVR